MREEGLETLIPTAYIEGKRNRGTQRVPNINGKGVRRSAMIAYTLKWHDIK